MKSILKPGAAAVILTMLSWIAPAWSGTVNITINTSALNQGLADVDGTLLPIGSIYRVGTFASLTPGQVATFAMTNDYASLNADWLSFADGTVGTNPGTVFMGNSELMADGSGLTGRAISLWVFNQPALPPGPMFAPGTQVGIWQSNDPLSPAMALAFPGSVPGTASFDFDPMLVTGARTFYGSFGVGTSPTEVPNNNFNLAPVPEPTAALLVGGWVSLLLLFRRRIK